MSKKFRLERGMRRLADDELMHWKYIKRYKKDGKWRYVYDYTATNAGQYRKSISDNLASAYKYGNIVGTSTSDSQNDLYEREERKYRAEAELQQARYKSYQKSVNYKVDSLIESVGTKTASALNAISDASDAGKKWLKRLFSK